MTYIGCNVGCLCDGGVQLLVEMLDNDCIFVLWLSFSTVLILQIDICS